MDERPIEVLRAEAAESGKAISDAFESEDWTTFHFHLGRIWMVAGMIYDRNHEADQAAQRKGTE